MFQMSTSDLSSAFSLGGDLRVRCHARMLALRFIGLCVEAKSLAVQGRRAKTSPPTGHYLKFVDCAAYLPYRTSDHVGSRTHFRLDAALRKRLKSAKSCREHLQQTAHLPRSDSRSNRPTAPVGVADRGAKVERRRGASWPAGRPPFSC
jgi:hypothetical protein